ncbi:NSF attachment protein [Kipferlia bialata]|uniref:Gamma-soluble NSF attachment protein n=1 Tax=Kipferlia bialata TaxID=797122 RepID=A0A391NIE7_9EUKA|nr:NSF attachment protein [Kipferlia bialata]|eukprot:g929.t1
MDLPDELMEKGRKHMRKGIFKRPDYSSAGRCFKNAVKGYKRDRQWTLAADATELLAEARDLEGQPLAAGLALREGGEFLLNVKEVLRAATLLQQAQPFLIESGKLVEAAECGEKAALCLLEINTPEAIAEAYELFATSLSTLIDEGRLHSAVQPYLRYVEALVDRQKWGQCLLVLTDLRDLFQRIEQPHNVNKATFASIIVCLAQNDIVGADEAFLRFSDYRRAEVGAAETLINHYRSRDVEGYKASLTSSALFGQWNCIATLARNLSPDAEDDLL